MTLCDRKGGITDQLQLEERTLPRHRKTGRAISVFV